MVDKWSVNFETHSRNDVMKVCALLAKGIGVDAVRSRRSKIVIYGGMGNGKSAIVDGITAAFSDAHSPYGLGRHTMFYEERPAASWFFARHSNFECNGEAIQNSMYHNVLDLAGLNVNVLSPFKRLRNNGLDFETYCVSTLPKFRSLSIKFSDVQTKARYSPLWSKKWNIEVNDRRMRTTDMAETLDHLRAFQERRQSRPRRIGRIVTTRELELLW